MSAILSIHFFPKKSSVNSNHSTLYVRITYELKRAEFSTGRNMETIRWNQKANKLRGNTEEVINMNRYIDTVKNKIYEIHDNLLREDEIISANIIKEIYLGKHKPKKFLLEIFQEHNDNMEKLIGKGYSKGTLQRYKAAYAHIQDYLLSKLRIDDILIGKVDHAFISGFEQYLKSEKDCAHNTAQKYIVNFKKIIRIAYANQWIERDPFFHWKGSWKAKEREFLTQQELDDLAAKEFSLPRLSQVRDIFLFCCYTGLAFVDVKKLSKDDVVIGVNGKRWIKAQRQKTKTLSSIPLLPVPMSIIEKYQGHPLVRSNENLLPVLTNQKSNAYLKEIADLCNIKKNLTTHLARHTFATTITLSQGVPIETVGKMLGHRSLKTTQIYARVLDDKIGRDMDMLESKLGTSL